MITYCFDIDGTICTNTDGDYEKATPDYRVIKRIKALYDDGHVIKLLTARGSTTGIDWRDVTAAQMEEWGVKYHELMMGKTHADVFVDDKAIHVTDWFRGTDEFHVVPSQAAKVSEPGGDIADLVRSRVKAAFDLKSQVLGDDEAIDQIARIGSSMVDALSKGNQVLLFGNGGSAADAQHISAELVGRFLRERRALPATALTVNPSIVTAISNDYSYDDVFARQIEALCKPGDVLIGISTSGNSTNVLRGFEVGRGIGVFAVGMTGATGGQMVDAADECFCVPSTDTQRIQEVHILVGHILCEIVEQEMFPGA